MAIPSLAMIPSGYKDGKVYSVLPTNGDGDFTFSRGSSATRVNKDGLIETMPLELGSEEVTNGSFDTDSDWSKGAGWTISGGTANADTSGTSELTQSITLIVGKVYKIELSISNLVSGLIQVQFDGTVIGQAKEEGVTTFYVSSTSSSTTLYIYAIGATKLSVDNVSIKEVLSGYDLPRLDYSDSSCPSLLLEPQSSNLITYSEDFSQSSWVKISGTVSLSNSLSPDGSLNAYRFYSSNSAANTRVYQNHTFSAATYTFSVYAKKNGTNNKFKFGISDSSGLTLTPDFNLTDDWERFEYTYTSSGGSGSWWVVNPSDTELGSEFDVLIYGAQLEEQSYPTSYIPTNGAISTRLQDECNGAGTSDTFNDSEGVLYAYLANSETSTASYLAISDGTNSQRLTLGNEGGYFRAYLNSVNIDDSVKSANKDFNKIAIKYTSSNTSIYINGLLIKSVNQSFSLSGINQITFSTGDNSYGKLRGSVKDIRYYNTALTDVELIALTTI